MVMILKFLSSLIKKSPLERGLRGVFGKGRNLIASSRGVTLLRFQKVLSIVILLFVLSLPACSSEEEPETPEVSEDVEILPEVIFSMADDRDLNVYIESQGVVEASREIIIRPRISGFVEATTLEDGARVQQGDLLLQFDDQEWQYQLLEAENEYEEALAAYRIESDQRQNRNGSSDDDSSNTMDGDRMVRISTGLAAAETALTELSLICHTPPLVRRLEVTYPYLNAFQSGHTSRRAMNSG